MFYKNGHLIKLNAGMNEQALVEQALRAVESVTGLIFESEPWAPGPQGRTAYTPDGLVLLSAPRAPKRFAMECKLRVASDTQLSLIRHQLAPWEAEARPLLVTQHLTPRQIDHCRDIDLDFMDASGNCLLRVDPLWVMVRGNKPSADDALVSRPYKGSTSYAALRVIYALLCRPELLSSSYRDIALAAGVSVGAVAMNLQELEARGLLSPRDKHKKRRLLDAAKLEAEWATNYPNKLRPRLGQRRFSAPSPDWWRQAQLEPNAFWGGEVAAFKLSGHVRPATQTVYLADTTSDAMNQFIRAHRLRSDAAGAVEVLTTFWNFSNPERVSGTVHPLLVYADLLGIKDSRAQDAASVIRSEFLHV
jgi:hypothetical protein